MNSKSQKDILEKLFTVLEDRKNNPSDHSYVTSLYRDGNNKINEKILEEAREYIEAIKSNKKGIFYPQTKQFNTPNFIILYFIKIFLNYFYKK